MTSEHMSLSQSSLSVALLLQSLDWNPSPHEASALQVQHIMDALQAHGDRVTVMATRQNKQVLYWPWGGVQASAPLTFSRSRPFRAVEGAARTAQSRLHLPWVQLFDSLRLYDALLQQGRRFDVLHERNSMHGFGAALAAARLRLPYVLSVDADFLYEHDFIGLRHTRLERLIATGTARFNYRLADVITCVSNVTKERLATVYGVPRERMVVIRNGAETPPLPAPAAVSAKQAELGLAGRPVAVFVGGFYPWHGLDTLVNAWRQVVDALPESVLLLVGDGQTRPATAQKVADAGLQRNVIFTGTAPHRTVPIYLALADVAVAPYPRLSAEFWGCPMKLFEYMAAGKALVASRAGDIGLVVEEGKTGLLVEPGNAPETARAILTVLRNPALGERMGEEARRTIQRQYTWASYARQLHDAYVRAAEGPRAPARMAAPQVSGK